MGDVRWASFFLNSLHRFVGISLIGLFNISLLKFYVILGRDSYLLLKLLTNYMMQGFPNCCSILTFLFSRPPTGTSSGASFCSDKKFIVSCIRRHSILEKCSYLHIWAYKPQKKVVGEFAPLKFFEAFYTSSLIFDAIFSMAHASCTCWAKFSECANYIKLSQFIRIYCRNVLKV